MSAGTAQQPSANAQLDGPGPWVYVRVEDTGPGIAPDRITAIFEPFEQADMTLTRQHGGTGLGLTIAKRLALLMGGDLTVRSQPGMGSVFFLWLPAAAEEAIDSTLSRSGVMDTPGPRLLQDVRDAILVELERTLHVYVARLRSDPGTPSAHSLSEAELEDHLATFLSDLAATFSSLDLAAGGDGDALRDSTAIQRTVSERHGSQRRRLGWGEEEIRREFQVLQEEVAAAIQRRVHGRARKRSARHWRPSPGSSPPPARQPGQLAPPSRRKRRRDLRPRPGERGSRSRRGAGSRDPWRTRTARRCRGTNRRRHGGLRAGRRMRPGDGMDVRPRFPPPFRSFPASRCPWNVCLCAADRGTSVQGRHRVFAAHL